MMRLPLAKLGWFAVLISTASLAQSSIAPTPLIAPNGDGTTDDTAAIQTALNAAAGLCAPVRLQCTWANTFKVSATLNVPKCVTLIGECGSVPDEGSQTTVGTTLKWAGGPSAPVVAFYDSPGASLTGVSVDCQNTTGAIGIQYYSDDDPPGSFVNIDTLMIKGCHQGLVLGDPSNTGASSCPPPTLPIKPGSVSTNCAEADQLKFERFRILGNLSDPAAEGVHINSANAAQGSLIINGNLQGVNIGVHVISTNGGLIVENTNIGSEVGACPPSTAPPNCGAAQFPLAAFIKIEPTVAASPTLINDEVESPPKVPVPNVAAVIDHGCNPGGTPGNPVWLNNVWNNHPITLDGSENVSSIGNLLNTAATLSTSAASNPAFPCTMEPHVLSVNETGWTTLTSPPTSSNLAIIDNGGATFGSSLINHDVIAVEAFNDPLRPGSGCAQGFAGAFQGLFPGDLIACEGQHLGQLYLGQDLMLLNNSVGGLVVQGQLTTQVRVGAGAAAGGSPPTIASGFGTSPSIVGTSNAGRITVGSGGASSGVVNFETAYTNPPLCVAQDETTSSAMRATASTTQLTITGTMTAADKLTYICLGYL
jgi:hypothetical protein